MLEDIKKYCMSKHKAYEDYPFGDVPICYKLNGKVFAQIYPYPEDYKITLKCTADAGQFYRMVYPGKVVRGYHCPPVQQPYWNTIYLDDENVDISGKSNDVEKKVNLAELLPDGLKLTSGSSSDLWITVNILPEGSKIYSFPTEDIKVKGLPDDLQMAFEVADIELKVQADDGNLSQFDLRAVDASLSMDDWEEGSYEVPINISLPNGYKLLEDVTAEIKVSKVSNADTGNSTK